MSNRPDRITNSYRSHRTDRLKVTIDLVKIGLRYQKNLTFKELPDLKPAYLYQNLTEFNLEFRFDHDLIYKLIVR